MNTSKHIFVVDSHTAGEPTRVVVGGLPQLPGCNVAEKMQYMRSSMDGVRTMLMNEPRGHAGMFGAILTEPCDSRADMGVIFMDGSGYINMCCHGSIGVVTVILEMGILEVKEPITLLNLETPAGIIQARAMIENGKVKSVFIRNLPAFLYRSGFCFHVEEIGELTADIAFGGNFFAILPVSTVGQKIQIDAVRKLTDIGMKIKSAVNATLSVEHPILKHINSVDLVEFYEECGSTNYQARNLVVFVEGDGQFDRSPCGTGTSAKLATLYAKGKLALGEEYRYAGVLGTVFKGTAIEETMVGEFTAVIPQVEGNAFITGISQMVMDVDDPVGLGFLV